MRSNSKHTGQESSGKNGGSYVLRAKPTAAGEPQNHSVPEGKQLEEIRPYPDMTENLSGYLENPGMKRFDESAHKTKPNEKRKQ
ncbi:hypothetical protein [Siminovitchia sp. 179-K 8D1 HS]|uniref:hypothetical protein n=1 Tax=Siminovitchia sp. 179-K 8D1 HS TaxID=3142385 RepID=UPI0039A0C9A8